MQLLLPASVLLLMVSVGMSLQLRELLGNWRRLTWIAWSRLLLATFILPPVAALILAHIFPLTLAETAGLFLVAATPGAPLLTRNLARRGFDMHLAASYQVWGAVMTPIMIPLLVAGGGLLYDRRIWIPPGALVVQIVEKELLPLLAGVALMHFAPAFCKKAQRPMNLVGNGLLTLVLVVLLWKMGPELRTLNVWIVLSVLLLMVAAVGSMHVLFRGIDRVGVRTLSVSNANRHVGLALMMSGRYMHDHHAIPVVACYAIVVAIMMVLAPNIFRPHGSEAQVAAA